MAENTIQQAEVVKNVKGVVGFSFKSPTPMALVWVFRIQFCANKALMFYLSATDAIPDNKVKSWMLMLATIDIFVWGIGRSIGVKPPEDNK